MSAVTPPPPTGAASLGAIAAGTLLVAAVPVVYALAVDHVDTWVLAIALWVCGLLIVAMTFAPPTSTDARSDRIRFWAAILIAPLLLTAVGLTIVPDVQADYQLGWFAAALVAAGLTFTRPTRVPWLGSLGEFLIVMGVLVLETVVIGFIAHRLRLFPTPERGWELAFATFVCCAVATAGIYAALQAYDRASRGAPRAKWATKDIVTVGLSCLALVVSVVSFAYPVVRTSAVQNLGAETYFKYLGANGEFAVAASEHYAEAGSPAAQFAGGIADVWMSHGAADLAPGSVYSGGDSITKFRVCLPTLETLPIQCAVASDVIFAESGKIRDFTLDGIPVGALLEVEDPDREPTAFAGDAAWADQVHVSRVSLIRGFDPAWAQYSDVPQPNVRTAVFLVTNASDRELALTSFTVYGSADVSDVEWSLNDIPAGDSRYLAVRSPQGSEDFEVCLRAQSEQACAPLVVRG
jgi:hypothetical protein